ncbi:MAG: PEGA domain-containing protein [Polyangiaceae bacterium]|nr:PEGA domain-containing protein [Polyangiaceae bacterium]
MQTKTTSRLGRSALSLIVAAAVAGAPTTSLFAQKKPAPAAAPAKDAKPDKAKQAQARDAYKRGQEKLTAGDFAGAAVAFKEANELIPAPQAQYKLAFALDKAGKGPEALAAYQALLASSVPESMAESKAAAEKRVAELGQATLKVTTNPPGASVKIDGERSLDASPMTATVKPGKHKIEVAMADHEPATRDVEVAAGAMAEVSLDLRPAPAAAPPPPVASSAAPVASSAPPAAPPPPEPRSKVPAYVVLGVGGAAAVVGAVFGMQALSAKSKFNDAPSTDRADKAESKALVADMAFGVALTLGVTGAVLLLTSDKPAEPKSGKLHLAPVITPRAQGAAATFTF